MKITKKQIYVAVILAVAMLIALLSLNAVVQKGHNDDLRGQLAVSHQKARVTIAKLKATRPTREEEIINQTNYDIVVQVQKVIHQCADVVTQDAFNVCTELFKAGEIADKANAELGN